MHPKELRISDFTYDLPEKKIAQKPLQERDASKLLIYKNGTISEDIYRNLASHIPTDSLIVFNQTKVIHARLIFQKTTGGIIEIFCLEPHSSYPDITTAMVQKKSVLWKCMVGGASKWKDGIVLEKIIGSNTLSAQIEERNTDGFVIQLSWDNEEMSFAEVLNLYGAVPLPPYMNRNAEEDDGLRYQTIFAKEEGSVAAPTAGLHFTNEILDSLVDKNIATQSVTLHVGAGTFQPVKTELINDHQMHAEWIEVSLETIEQLIASTEKNIIAVGTTSLRTIESLYWIGVKLLNGILPDFKHIAVTQWEPYELSSLSLSKGKSVDTQHALNVIRDWMLQNRQEKIITKTQIMIAPGYQFRVINALITNFHQPQSTLLLLIAAMIGEDWKQVYQYALENDYRFLSYGDGSLLWLN